MMVAALTELVAAARARASFPARYGLGVCPFAESPELCVGTVGLFLRLGLVPALAGTFAQGRALVSLIREGHQPLFYSSPSTPQQA